MIRKKYQEAIPEYAHSLYLYEKDSYVVYASFRAMMKKSVEEARLQKIAEQTVQELTADILKDIEISISI